MKIIYKILSTPINDAWYQEYQVADDFPATDGFVETPPPTELKFPMWSYGLGWHEDKDKLIISLNQQILDGQTQIGQLQSDLLDMMELVSTLGGEASV